MSGGHWVMKRIVKRTILTAVHATGYTISRRPVPSPDEPPPIFEDPLEALHYHQGGKPAAFFCPLDQTRHMGFDPSSRGWHPFVAALQEYHAGLATSYQDSVLEAFYDSWQPDRASDAIPGFAAHAPPAFRELPSPDASVAPWISYSVGEMRERFHSWYRKDNAQFSAEFDPDTHGHKDFGPVHPDHGELEFRRLTEVFASIRDYGYDRTLGDVNVGILRRGSDLRFIKWGPGTHRTAAMAALGHATIPATFSRTRGAIFDVADVDYWPNVRNGIWYREAATRYVDHLFDFDSVQWARDRDLLLGQRHPDWHAAALRGRRGQADSRPQGVL